MDKPHRTMLAQIRRASGKSQATVAAELGVSKATYSAWETGRAELGAERLRDLSACFGCTPNDILGFEGGPSRFPCYSEQDENDLALLHKLPPSIRECLIAVARYSSKR